MVVLDAFHQLFKIDERIFPVLFCLMIYKFHQTKTNKDRSFLIILFFKVHISSLLRFH